MEGILAKLFFRYSAMNSGKSTALMQVAFNYEERGMNVLIIKPKKDTKGGDKVVSRIGIERKADILASENMNLRKVIKQWNKDVEKVSCVLVDEVQFLTERHIDQLFEVTVKDGIPVICYGLRIDFSTQLFPGSKRLFALAHSLEEIKTICTCGKKATLIGRKVDDKYVFEGPQVAIDGEGDVTYESLCGTCYFREKEKATK